MVHTLDEAIALLGRDDVDEIIIQSGQPPRMLKGFAEQMISDRALTASEIVGMLGAAQLHQIVPRADTAGEEHRRSIDGRELLFRIARFLDLIELRISLADPDLPATNVRHTADQGEATLIVTAPKALPSQETPRRRTQPSSPTTSRPADPAPAPTKPPLAPQELAPGKATATTATTGPDTKRDTPLPVVAARQAPTKHDTPFVDDGAGQANDTGTGTTTKRDTPLADDVAAPRHQGAVTTQVQSQGPPPGTTTSDAAPALASPAVPPPPDDDDPNTAAGLPAPVRTRRTLTLTRGEAEHDVVHEGDAPKLASDLSKLIAHARTRGASDVHLMSDEPVRVRIAGQLTDDGSRVSAAILRSAIEQLLSPWRATALAERGYVDLGVTDPRAGRLRLNICRHRAGLKLCARIVAMAPSTPSELGLPWEVEAISNHHQGLVICSGPSGAGKTTTMAALVQTFNERKPVHIITVEDPVEIEYPISTAIVSQREVGRHTLSFASALKAALREDPDIIVIGELRDRETVEMALAAAETGHLVLATMRTPSGAETIDRLIDMFPPEDQNQVRTTLAGALKLIVSQRLVEAADGARLVAAFEVITGNVPLWSLIRDSKLFQLPSLLQRGRAYGMVRLEDSLRGLMLSQTISRQTALAHAGDPKLLGGHDESTPPSRRARGGSR